MGWNYHGRNLGRTQPEQIIAERTLPGFCKISFHLEIMWSAWSARSPAALALSEFRGLVQITPNGGGSTGKAKFETSWILPDADPHWYLIDDTPGTTRLVFSKQVPVSLLEAFEDARDGSGMTVTYWLRCQADAVEVGVQRNTAGIIPPHPLTDQHSQQILDESWRNVLKSIGFFESRVLDVRVQGRVDAASLARADRELSAAREALARGDHDEAVRLCRRSLEEVRQDMKETGVQQASKSLVGRYRGYIDALLRVAHPSTHADSTQQGEAIEYARADALFMIESTSAFIVRAARQRW